MLIIIIKAVVIYLFLLILIRLMGKREISKLSPFDLVVAIMIAELAALPIEDKTITLFEGVLPITVLVLLEIIFAYISLKSNFMRRLINGKPIILIKEGKIVVEALQKTRYNLNDLLLQLRKKDIFDIKRVKLAILETSGDLTIVNNDLEDGIILPVVIDKKISRANLEIMNIKEEWLENKLKKMGLNLSDILLATIDEDKNIEYYRK